VRLVIFWFSFEDGTLDPLPDCELEQISPPGYYKDYLTSPADIDGLYLWRHHWPFTRFQDYTEEELVIATAHNMLVEVTEVFFHFFCFNIFVSNIIMVDVQSYLW